ncbi:hypothetical protein DXX93_08685 [Thalassotalea euphylliae]|uniref:Uncharacterized protein n=1 Tax=Thalassotalea euphylliae TaxID=1655234 RepID=A0A3E0TQN1_9GAMM|nr:hypothetical protein [Thalassotalea euphylliae]REL26647.1 hypothetical protein DXX93_08685 [Thalassotalea euphylliae]
MSASISLLSNSETTTNLPEIASVHSTDEFGRIASIILLTSDSLQAVSAQAKHIVPGIEGELVVVLNTRQGWVVVSQLADKSDAPAARVINHNGHVRIEGAKSVSLSTAKGSIEVFDDGNIVLEGTQVVAASERDFTIAGWPIRLN